MSDAWDLLVARDDLSKIELVERDLLVPGDGEVLLKVDRVGLTTNNVTYALAGDLLNYWSFFPAPEGSGRVPLWGFADVAASNHEEVAVGARVYGYLPMSSDLVVTPANVRSNGFLDASPHRAELDSAYNVYADTSGDAAYSSEHEDLQILFRPLFITSFMLDDFLGDSAFFGAQQIVVSSASSKTAYATAFCIAQRNARPRLIGLTSPGNVEFTRSLPYEEVVSYSELDAVATDTPTLYLDFAGKDELRARVHSGFGEALVYDCLVGVTHQEGLGAASGSDLAGPEPVFFFAPHQISKRRKDWGPGEIDKRYGAMWQSFVPQARGWVKIQESKGAEGLRAAWVDVLSGRVDPKAGLIISL